MSQETASFNRGNSHLQPLLQRRDDLYLAGSDGKPTDAPLQHEQVRGEQVEREAVESRAERRRYRVRVVLILRSLSLCLPCTRT